MLYNTECRKLSYKKIMRRLEPGALVTELISESDHRDIRPVTTALVLGSYNRARTVEFACVS